MINEPVTTLEDIRKAREHMDRDNPPPEEVYQYKGEETKGLVLGDVVNLAGCIYQVRKVMKRGRFLLKYLGDDPDAE